MPNIFVSYDLDQPNRNYPAIEKAIKECGQAVRILQSVWYIKSTYDQKAIRNHIAKVMDKGDRLLVITASSAIPQNADKAAWDFILESWNK